MNNLSNEELVNKFNSMRGLYMVYGKFQNERDFEQAEAISKELFAIIAAGEEAVKEVERLKAYSDKLAEGLPEGMLPKDIELLRKSNCDMSQQIIDMESGLNNMKCCGNCDYLNECEDKLLANSSCIDWDFDGLTKEERIKP